eukprot:1824321-Amphidinium_carterae.1
MCIRDRLVLGFGSSLRCEGGPPRAEHPKESNTRECKSGHLEMLKTCVCFPASDWINTIKP